MSSISRQRVLGRICDHLVSLRKQKHKNEWKMKTRLMRQYWARTRVIGINEMEMKKFNHTHLLLIKASAFSGHPSSNPLTKSKSRCKRHSPNISFIPPPFLAGCTQLPRQDFWRLVPTLPTGCGWRYVAAMKLEETSPPVHYVFLERVDPLANGQFVAAKRKENSSSSNIQRQDETKDIRKKEVFTE